MSTYHRKMRFPLVAFPVALVVLTTLAGGAQATAAPVKLIPTSHIASGLGLSRGIAVNNDHASPTYGDLYVTEAIDDRVQILTPAGGFVAMFGWDVNAAEDKEPSASQAAKDLCTAESKATCQAGVEGGAAEAFADPESVTVDPSTGDVYVLDYANHRVDEYTAMGQFVLAIGREVNETNDKKPGASTDEKNVCTAESADTCKAGIASTLGSTEHGAFNFAQASGDLLAAGGPEGLLYVGDAYRVQELKPNGAWVREIPLASISNRSQPEYDRVQALALDQGSGDVYLVYPLETAAVHDPLESEAVHEFATEGRELASFSVGAREPNGDLGITAIGLDPAGHLAIWGEEDLPSARVPFGSLYDAASSLPITGFTAAPGSGIAFNAEGDLYADVGDGSGPGEVWVYTPEPVAELLASPAACKAGVTIGTSVTLDCTLNGEVNPEGVAETEALFQWGTTPGLGQATVRQKVEEPSGLHAVIDGVRPNQTLYYQLIGYDHYVQAPEQLLSAVGSHTSETVPPRVLGTPSATFVGASSASLSGELNPENANTTYSFEYAKACAVGEACPAIAQAPDVMHTASSESSAYGPVDATLEAAGLQPATSYRYQLTAVNQSGQEALDETGGIAIAQGTFTTAPAPVPQAASGTASAVGATSATISGSVEPDGGTASYSFELGVDAGAETQYGVVSSGPAGAGSGPVEESQGLTGLQPGTTYAFRIAIHSGYIQNGENTLRGAPVLFTTAGVPAVLAAPVSPKLLATPAIAFPVFPKSAVAGKGKKPKPKRKAKRKRKHVAKQTKGRRGSRKAKR
jgi:hypothetical protein